MLRKRCTVCSSHPGPRILSSDKFAESTKVSGQYDPQDDVNIHKTWLFIEGVGRVAFTLQA